MRVNIRDSYSDLNWKSLAGLRDKLILPITVLRLTGGQERWFCKGDFYTSL